MNTKVYTKHKQLVPILLFSLYRHKPVLDFIETGEEHEVHLNGNHIHHHQVCLHFIITFKGLYYWISIAIEMQ